MTSRRIHPDTHRPDLGKPHGFEGEFTEEVFTFHAMPPPGGSDCPHIRQEPALCQSILTVSGSVAPGMRIVGVYVNGAPRGFAHITQAGRAGEQTVCVWPLIPLQCDRVRVECEGPSKPPGTAPRPLMPTPRHHTSPKPSYGLTAPQNPIGPRP